MKIPFYRTGTRIDALRTEAASWLGTPFRQGCRVKGERGGVDCIGLNLSCYEASGFAAPGEVELPKYDIEHYEHSDVSLLDEWFRQYAKTRMVMLSDAKQPMMDGDTLFIRHRRAVHHVALWVSGLVYFTMRGQGAMNIRQENIWKMGAEIRSVFRPVEICVGVTADLRPPAPVLQGGAAAELVHA